MLLYKTIFRKIIIERYLCYIRNIDILNLTVLYPILTKIQDSCKSHNNVYYYSIYFKSTTKAK